MPNLIDYVGQRFGKLLVVARVPCAGRAVIWQCVCDCGGTANIRAGNLRSGNTTSCGCVRVRTTRSRSLTHGHSVGGSSTPEHRAWKQALNRCRNDKLPSWPDYGGRGIRMCPEWEASFSAFFEFMGKRPTPKHSLDRIDTNGDYEPGNCRWATAKEQSRNTRRNPKYAYNGALYCLAELAEIAGISISAIHYRRAAGWTVERMVTTPMRHLTRPQKT